MKNRAFLGLILLLGSSLFADPAEGFWLSVDEQTGKITAGWELFQENGKLLGRILSIAGHPQDIKASACRESYRGFPRTGKVNELPIVGPPWIFGLSPERSAGHWRGGSVIDPNDGKIYQCRITYHPADGKRFPQDALEMRGEIGLGIGRSQFWRRSTREEASSLRE
ncbi:MAG: DUF2147 domain-containing protein [Spirochaetaceae bacterium]|nr:DUF2147 domain-containing protein [Spirochaetaceae bacterium]